MSSRTMVDWPLAVKIGTKVSGDNPNVSLEEATGIVAELRAGANRSTALVREFTGLVAPENTAPVLVVDRAGWIQANSDAFAHLLTPITDAMAARASKHGVPATGAVHSIGSRITGAEVGLVLGLLSSRVLGQFDPFYEPSGRLLLVAPNIVKVERELGVDPTDFRLWVCLHEETHRVQFTAVPWLRGHLFSLMEQVLSSVEPQALVDQLKAFAEQPRDDQAQPSSLLERISSPEQRVLLDQVTGVMSLLEGHADVVMDGVGPTVIPSVEKIRAGFTTRRAGVGVLDKIVRRLLGMDAKMAQYRDGAKFVRQVVDKVGMEEFNKVWAAPENLPNKAEIADPAAWMTRVLQP